MPKTLGGVGCEYNAGLGKNGGVYPNDCENIRESVRERWRQSDDGM